MAFSKDYYSDSEIGYRLTKMLSHEKVAPAGRNKTTGFPYIIHQNTKHMGAYIALKRS